MSTSMTTTELWNILETQLREKGCSEEWLRYAMADIHTALTVYGNNRFHAGYIACENGDGCGAYDPPGSGSDTLLDGFGPAEGMIGHNG